MEERYNSKAAALQLKSSSFTTQKQQLYNSKAAALQFERKYMYNIMDVILTIVYRH